MDYQNSLLDKLTKSLQQRQTLMNNPEQLSNFNRVVHLLVECFRRGGTLYIAGNGGSAADSGHLAGEFVCKIGKIRPGIKAECIVSDVATLTAIANDFGYEHTLLRQLETKLKQNDVFLAISTSGNSPNVIKALQSLQTYATVLLSGPTGGLAAKFASYTMLVPGDTTSEIQELHETLYHCLVECVEKELYPDPQ